MSQQMTIFTPTSKLPRPQDISPLSPCSFLPAPCSLLHYPAPTRVVADDVSECGAVCVCVCMCVWLCHTVACPRTHTHTHTRTAYERFFLSLSLPISLHLSLSCFLTPQLGFPFLSFHFAAIAVDAALGEKK